MEYGTLGRTNLRVCAIAPGCEGFMRQPASEVEAYFKTNVWNI